MAVQIKEVLAERNLECNPNVIVLYIHAVAAILDYDSDKDLPYYLNQGYDRGALEELLDQEYDSPDYH